MEAGPACPPRRESGKPPVFGELDGRRGTARTRRSPTFPNWTEKDTLAGREGVAGILGDRASAGSLTRRRSANWPPVTPPSLEGLGKKTPKLPCAACCAASRASANKEGKPWVALTIEDQQGSVDGMVFASSYERPRPAGGGRPGRVWCAALILPEEKRAAQGVGAGYHSPRCGNAWICRRDFHPRLAGPQRRHR